MISQEKRKMRSATQADIVMLMYSIVDDSMKRRKSKAPK